MNTYTPGPWTPYQYKTGIGVRAAKIVLPARTTTVSICRISIADNSIHRETGWANARLISAAPDLLAAIVNSDNAYWTPAMRAAITKATGIAT